MHLKLMVIIMAVILIFDNIYVQSDVCTTYPLEGITGGLLTDTPPPPVQKIKFILSFF